MCVYVALGSLLDVLWKSFMTGIRPLFLPIIILLNCRTRRDLNVNIYFRYKILAPRKKLKDVKAQVVEIVNKLGLDEDKYKIGLTKIFLRAGQVC